MHTLFKVESKKKLLTLKFDFLLKHSRRKVTFTILCVATLALGSRPRQRACKGVN